MLPNPAARSSLGMPLGRKRTVNHGLPPRMARKGESYYYVCNAPRKWLPLGSDLAKAKRRWSELEDCGQVGLSVGDLVQQYIDRTDRPTATANQYRTYHKAIADGFPIPAAQLRSTHVALWQELQKDRKTYANGCIALLVAAFRYGKRLGVCETIDAERWYVAERDRYLTDAEFIAIRKESPEWLQILMDLAYLTASRPGDLRALRWMDVGSELTLRQEKTGQRMSFSMTPELFATLERARSRRILGLYVCATERGKPITKGRMGEAWRAACRSAGVSNAQPRDLRAKAATDAAKGGQDFQALLGHTTRKMSERYIKDKRTIVAEPVRRKL